MTLLTGSAMAVDCQQRDNIRSQPGHEAQLTCQQTMRLYEMPRTRRIATAVFINGHSHLVHCETKVAFSYFVPPSIAKLSDSGSRARQEVVRITYVCLCDKSDADYLDK